MKSAYHEKCKECPYNTHDLGCVARGCKFQKKPELKLKTKTQNGAAGEWFNNWYKNK